MHPNRRPHLILVYLHNSNPITLFYIRYYLAQRNFGLLTDMQPVFKNLGINTDSNTRISLPKNIMFTVASADPMRFFKKSYFIHRASGFIPYNFVQRAQLEGDEIGYIKE